MEDIAEGIRLAMKAGDLLVVEELPAVVVEHPVKKEHGDYASPVAMSLARILKKKPIEIAEIIAKHMPRREYAGRVEVMEPGFLNVRINPGWLTARLDDMLEEPLCEAPGSKVRRIDLEFISANPTGPLTLGNARTAFSVDTLANVLTCAGVQATREYYINDAGQQIKKLGESIIRRALMTRGEKIDYPEELYQGEYIVELAGQIAESLAETDGQEFSEEDIEDEKLKREIGQRAASIMLSNIEEVLDQVMQIKFDVWTSESSLREKGAVEETVEALRKAKATYVKDGTEFLKTTDFGDTEDRVLIKQDGEYAYIAPDLAYHRDKYERGFDEIFTFVGVDHQGHAAKLKAGMSAMGYNVDKLHVVAAQWMTFLRDGKQVKLSKRQGNIVTPKELIDEVGYDAARFFMVMHALTTHMEFDIALAKERSERNPVYYVQYAYVRLQSILRRAKEEGVIEKVGEEIPLTSHGELTHTTELALMRQLYMLPEVIEEITQTYEVHSLTHYATELARAVHVFYKNVPVLRSDKQSVLMSRLQLVLAAKRALGQVLDLLGVSKPDVM